MTIKKEFILKEKGIEIIYIDDISKGENIKYLDDIVQIMKEVFWEENIGTGIKCSYMLLSEIYWENVKNVFVAIKKDNIIGFLLYSDLFEFTSYINWFAVKKDFRNIGIGGVLLAKLEEKLIYENKSNVFLISQDSNYYEKFNYEKVRKTHRDKIIWDIKRDEWIMIKSLF